MQSQTTFQSPVVYLGADHGGYELKEKAKFWLKEWGYETQDVGALALDPQDDYPQFAFDVAQKVVEMERVGSGLASGSGNQPLALGLLFCRSSGGMTIAANKTLGARAVSLESVESAKHARSDNQANIGSLAADWLSEDQAKEIIKVFLTTAFSGESRHQRRLAQITTYERSIQAPVS